jgi:hypothetical protein
MDKESAVYYLVELEDNIKFNIMQDWHKKKGTNRRQSWHVIPAGKLIREWKYNQQTGLVHNSIIEELSESIIENYCKLYINTVLMGHTSMSPYSFIEACIPEEWDEEELDNDLEDYEWFACDEEGSWRISDYAIDKLFPLIIELLTEDNPNTKLYIIDKILNVTHQRSDLARWFVEGGSSTLSSLFSE